QLFESYITDQQTDQHYVDVVKQKLEAVGLAVSTAGRKFEGPASDTDIVVIDLFFGISQDNDSFNESKKWLLNALQLRKANPPLVILMSRSTRLEEKREEFRDEVGLL